MTILDILAFENLERVWIERTERQVREGRKKVTKSQFDLHIVRSTESGSAYEDTVEQDVPFMLLDSMEALDADVSMNSSHTSGTTPSFSLSHCSKKTPMP